MDHKRKTDFTMPYKSSGIIISGTQYDRRQKLTPFQKAEIFHRYMTEAGEYRTILLWIAGADCRYSVTFPGYEASLLR